MVEVRKSTGILPNDFVYERRASTLTSSVPGNTSGYILINWLIPEGRPSFLLYGIGTDQHLNSEYTWVVDGVELPISGPARVGSIDNPYNFPEPIIVSSTIVLYITNDNADAYPNAGTGPYDEYGYDAMFFGRYS